MQLESRMCILRLPDYTVRGLRAKGVADFYAQNVAYKMGLDSCACASVNDLDYNSLVIDFGTLLQMIGYHDTSCFFEIMASASSPSIAQQSLRFLTNHAAASLS